MFDMRIHDGEYTIGRILDKCRVDPRESTISSIRGRRVIEGVDLDLLSQILRRMPVDNVRARRERLNTFYEEMLVSADAMRGISFHSCLMILAHHNVINDSKSLRLEEFLRRRARLQRVEEAVQRNTVIGFFDTLFWSREFRRKVDKKKSARMSVVPQFTVPEIFVDDEYEYRDHAGDNNNNDTGDNITTQEVTISDNNSSSTDLAGTDNDDNDNDTQPMLSPTSPRAPDPNSTSSPTGARHNLPRIDTGLAGRMSAGAAPSTEWLSISPSLAPGRGRAHTTSSYDPGLGAEPDDDSGDGTGVGAGMGAGAEHARQNSAMSVQEVMNSLDNSAWGESLRRSFTQRRPGERSS